MRFGSVLGMFYTLLALATYFLKHDINGAIVLFAAALLFILTDIVDFIEDYVSCNKET